MLKKAIRFLFRFLPKRFRFEIMRRSFQISRHSPQSLEVCVANDQKDLEGAFRVLHDAYVEQGFISQEKNGLRITKYHMLPTTTTIVAKWNSEVVGTLTLVRKNTIGYPLEKVFDISSIKNKYDSLAEITALGIKKENRRAQGGEIFFPLLKFMYEYSAKYFSVDALVIVIHPKDLDFYCGILAFKIIPGTKTVDYMGAPAVALVLDLKTAKRKFKWLYSHREPGQNLLSYFTEQRLECIRLPKREFHSTLDPFLTKVDFEHFFISASDLLKKLNEGELLSIYFYYRFHEISELLLPRLDDIPNSHLIRLLPRFESNLQGIVQKTKVSFRVLDHHNFGLRIKLTKVSSFESPALIDIQIAEGKTVTLKVKMVRLDGNERTLGLHILESNPDWDDFNNHLSHRHKFDPTILEQKRKIS